MSLLKPQIQRCFHESNRGFKTNCKSLSTLKKRVLCVMALACTAANETGSLMIIYNGTADNRRRIKFDVCRLNCLLISAKCCKTDRTALHCVLIDG